MVVLCSAIWHVQERFLDPAGAFVAAVVHPRNSPLSLVDVSLAIWGGGGPGEACALVADAA